MVAAVMDNVKINIDPGMKGPLTGSVIFHLAIVILCIVGLPILKSEVPLIEEAITVELMNIDEVTEEKAEQPKKVLKRPEFNDKPPEPVKKVMPKLEKLPKPTPAVPPEVKKDDIAPPEKTKITKIEKPPVPKKRPEKAVAEEQRDINTVLKNLLESEPEQQADEKAKDAPKPSPFQQRMTMGENQALITQLSQCWKLMSGARYAENHIVKLTMTVNPDRTVGAIQIVDQLRYNSDSYFRAAADSAVRAVRDPHCTPLDLPQDKYNLWKSLTITFDPREML